MWTIVAQGNKPGKSIELLFPLEKIQEIARRGHRVRIQDTNNPGHSVTSLPDTFPIHDVRNGKTIGASHGSNFDQQKVKDIWESPKPELLGHMWFKDCAFKDLD